MIPYQTFHCPRCGAPGHVNMGQAEYSCLCRFDAHQEKVSALELAFAEEPQRSIVNEATLRIGSLPKRGDESPLADFIHNATREQKAEVYDRVMDSVAEQQQAVLDRAASKKGPAGGS